ncbi:2OG-Fe(II) oxygenase [endosymbiont GvMRE of Glomus versiforme]|uniref:2OG-Fe(II)-dependent halogenase WelO5 family protein n=1 Tax=endosymbiont GvMRE of Glomus versiforme TaxID=2039283 RepID=UPI000EC0A224|nr:2OG-Fe(II) oxygenase [endosymbiont GvMRE of Glomus versiforme]RHZ35192.1 2OG-Fe(II) oxygenase superfamily protein [endosymbiont GvMRE of Glomus versiforme]
MNKLLPKIIEPRFLNTIIKSRTYLPTTEIIRVDSLNYQCLCDFFDGKIFVLRVPKFCDNNIIKHGLKNIQKHEIIDYSNVVEVGKIRDLGMAYYEVKDRPSKNLYYEQVTTSINALRKAFCPFLSPIDKIRLLLDEQWERGASRLNLGGGNMFVGLMRASEEELFPHEDKLERDDRNVISKFNYMTQAAFNCYLKIPETGGALQLWNTSLEDDEYKILSDGCYGIKNKSLLPPPVVTIYPEVGELIIFHSRCLHAITKSSKTRIGVSGFILYQGKEKPLHLWS